MAVLIPPRGARRPELTALDERLALLSVLHELTVAVLDLFEPTHPVDHFLEKLAARLGCSVALCVEACDAGSLALCGSAGLAARSRELRLPELPAGGIEAVRFPYPELTRAASCRWVAPTQAAARAATRPSWIVLSFEREPRHPSQYRGMVQRLALHLGAALSHRAMYERVLRSEQALQQLNDELETRVADRTQQLASMTAQLLQADRLVAIGTLAAAVGHEINNPLSYVQSGLDFVGDELRALCRGDAESRLREIFEVLAEMRTGIQRIRSVARDLRTFSRGDQDSRRSLEVSEIVDSSLEFARNEIRHRARLVKEYRRTPRVEANESRLGQVFLNVLINAAHAIPEGNADENEIRVATGTDGDGRAVVEIRDTGCGIASRDVARIFDPFFTTKPVGVGTGLGLSICRNIVTTLGGTISAESELGRGTTVRIVLPAAAVAQPAAEPARATTPAVAPRRRVLVIDDDPLVGGAVRRAISAQHDVTLLTSARDARQRIGDGERFDAIVCDLMMPDMTGMELHDDLSRSVPDQAARIIFMTGGAFTSSARAFLERVGNPRVDKPFAPAELCELIRSVAS